MNIFLTLIIAILPAMAYGAQYQELPRVQLYEENSTTLDLMPITHGQQLLTVRKLVVKLSNDNEREDISISECPIVESIRFVIPTNNFYGNLVLRNCPALKMLSGIKKFRGIFWIDNCPELTLFPEDFAFRGVAHISRNGEDYQSKLPPSINYAGSIYVDRRHLTLSNIDGNVSPRMIAESKK